MQPTSYTSNMDIVHAPEPAYAEEDFPSFDEDEPPTTPSAADVEVEESPTALGLREFVEKRSKSSQIPTASNRIKVPAFSENILDDPTFSFMPTQQQFTLTQRLRARSPPQEPPAAQDIKYEAQALAENANTHSPQALGNRATEVMGEQPHEDTLANNEDNMNEVTLVAQHESSGFHFEPLQRQQEREQGVIPLQDDTVHVAEDDTIGNHHTYGDHDSYMGQDDRISVIDDAQPNHAPGSFDSAPAQTVPYPGTDDEDVIDLTKEASPSTTEDARVRDALHQPAVTRAGEAPIHDARISKASRRRPARSSQNPHIHRRGTARPVQQPSEEDLLFLLMARARDNNQARKRLDHVERENKNLQQQKMQLDASLQQTMDSRDGCAQEYTLLSQNLEQFKEKYSKLKKWALETNKDCEQLQEQAASFNRALSNLTKDKTHLVAQLQDAQSSAVTVAEQIVNVRGEVREVNLMAEERLRSVDHMSGLLVSKDQELKKETQRGSKLELQITQLEQEKEKHTLRMHNDQQELNKTLQAMSGSLQALHDQGVEKMSEEGVTAASLGRIQAVLDSDMGTKADICSLKSGFDTTVASLDEMKQAICEKLQQVTSTVKDDLQKDASTHAESLLSAVQSESSRLVEVKTALASLEQKAENAREIVKLLRETKVAAEGNLKVIADNLTKALGPEKEAAKKEIEHLMTQLGELRTKWQRACSDRATCEQERQQEKTQQQSQLERSQEEGRQKGNHEGKESGRLEGREEGRQEGRRERDDEHQADTDDLLALLSETIQEQNCLQSELSKAEESFQIVEKQKKQEQEQRDVEIADQDHRTECQFRDMQEDIDYGLHQRVEAQQEIASLKISQLQLQGDLEISRGETLVAIREQHALHDKITDFENRLDWAENNLGQATGHLVETMDALGLFVLQQSHLEQLEKDFQSQKQTVEAKGQEIESLRKEIEQLQARSAQLAEQVRGKEQLREENNVLGERLRVAQQEAQVIPDLKTELEEKKTQVGDLESALAASQQDAREKKQLASEIVVLTKRLKELENKNLVIPELQKRQQQKNTKITELEDRVQVLQGVQQENDKLSEENAAINKQLRDLQKENATLADVKIELQHKSTELVELEAALSDAQEEAARVTGLLKTNTSLKENVVSLNSDLEQLNEECAQIGPLKETVNAQHDELAELQRQLSSPKARTEDLAKLQEELQRKEDERATMQQQILNLEGALLNANLDKVVTPPQQPRRLADRSGTTNVSPNSQLRHSHPDASREVGLSNAETLVSSAQTSVIPDTQLEVPDSVPIEQDSLVLQSQSQDDIESDSPPSSDDEDDALEDENEDVIANSQPYSRGQGYVSPSMSSARIAAHIQAPSERPSSSYSSMGDQMLLDEVSQDDARSAGATVPITATPGFLMPGNMLGSMQMPSPKRLRSGLQVGQNAATPEPSTQQGRNRASTPAIRREQYQPNSAAKRRMEPDAENDASQETTKKLKRRPANMEVRALQPRTPTQTAGQTPSRGSGSWRKSSTVVGTNAPAPGKSQRSSKSARKGSKQDVYTSRFADA